MEICAATLYDDPLATTACISAAKPVTLPSQNDASRVLPIDVSSKHVARTIKKNASIKRALNSAAKPLTYRTQKDAPATPPVNSAAKPVSEIARSCAAATPVPKSATVSHLSADDNSEEEECDLNAPFSDDDPFEFD